MSERRPAGEFDDGSERAPSDSPSQELPSEAEDALRAFAERAMPAGRSLGESRDAVVRAVRRRKLARRAGAALVVSGVAALALAIVSSRAPNEAVVASVIEARGASSEDGTLVRGQALTHGDVSVRTDGSLHLRVGDAAVRLDGPTRARLHANRIDIDSGEGSLQGSLTLAGCGCTTEVNGEVRFEAAASFMRIIVIAGSVEVRSPAAYCHIEDLDLDRVARADPPALAPEDAPVPRVETVAHAVRTSRCDLGAQADAYRSAIGLADASQQAAELRRVRRRFPRCPLSHEVDVALIEALLRAGRQDDAADEARRFTRTYPRSARRDEMRRLARR